MKNVVVDKLASVAQHNDLTRKLRLSADIPCEEGVLVAVRVLNNKSRYNQLELTSGRMATVTMGDVIVGALGHRKALRGTPAICRNRCNPATKCNCSISAESWHL